jgi:threonine/homoserine/homoserine lactone efflux protein
VWWLFVKGLGVGIAIAAPIGPVGVLCVRRTLASGRLMGLASGFGAAVADALYGLIAAFGITLVAEWLLQQASVLRAVGGLFLLIMGGHTLLRRPAQTVGMVPRSRGGLVRAFGSTFILTLTNPITLMAFLGIFATIGLAQAAAGAWPALILVAGVFSGSACWWLLLALGAGRLRHRLEGNGMRSINLVSGVILVGFGLYAWGSLLLR